MKRNEVITVHDAETWTNVQAYGTYEQDYKNGELWSWNGKLYYLASIELDTEERIAIVDLGIGTVEQL